MDDWYSVIGLTIENLRGIKAIQLAPPPTGLVTINGKNAAGKSSVLDAIEIALGGAKAQPAEPIRHGTESAVVIADLGGYIVKRTFSKKGSYLKVERKQDGVTMGVAKPQEFLDALCGTGIGLDPLEFANLKPADQVKMLLDIVSLPRDPRAIDAEVKELYDARTLANRRVKELEVAHGSLPWHPQAPAQEVALSDLLAEQQAMLTEKSQNDLARRRLQEMEKDARRLTAEVARLQAELAKAEALLADVEGRIQIQGYIVRDLVDPDMTDLVTRLLDAERTNGQVRANMEKERLSTALHEARSKAENLVEKIEGLREEKASLLRSASFPVPDLSIVESDGGYAVAYKGTVLADCASSEKLRVSLALAVALHPQVRVALIREASLLDEDSLRSLAEMAQANKFQVWVERVASVAEGAEAFLIEEGEMAERP